MNIYLLRHGETDWNIEGRFQGRKDIPMNENGIHQIKSSMETVSAMITSVDVILSSPLRRAQKSAEIAAESLGYAKEEIVIEPLYIERAFGEAEGQKTTQMWEEQVIMQYAGAETTDEICCRAAEALKKTITQYAGKNVLVAAHGAVLKAVLAAVLGQQTVYEEWKMKLESGCVHWLKLEEDMWTVAKCDMKERIFREIGHGKLSGNQF